MDFFPFEFENDLTDRASEDEDIRGPRVHNTSFPSPTEPPHDTFFQWSEEEEKEVRNQVRRTLKMRISKSCQRKDQKTKKKVNGNKTKNSHRIRNHEEIHDQRGVSEELKQPSFEPSKQSSLFPPKEEIWIGFIATDPPLHSFDYLYQKDHTTAVPEDIQYPRFPTCPYPPSQDIIDQRVFTVESTQSEHKTRKGQRKRTEKKDNESKIEDSHRNCLTVLVRFFLNKMIQGELDVPSEELMLIEEDIDYPPQFYMEVDKEIWKKFIEDLGKKKYFSIGYCRQWWLLPFIDEKAGKSVLEGMMEEWKELHFFVCLKRYFRIFLEEHAFYSLFMDYRERDRFINLEDYFTYIPCILNAIEYPETFFSLKINEEK